LSQEALPKQSQPADHPRRRRRRRGADRVVVDRRTARQAIIDLAVGLDEQHDFARVRAKLEAEKWLYRGDAGGDGGHVFVLEARPWHRVAHIHVVDHGGTQWYNYLRLRDLLLGSPTAQAQYQAVKLRLIEEVGNDRKRYTDAKSDVVRTLLSEFG